jgi:hypothetical protein
LKVASNMTRTLAGVSAAIEIATGLALIASPNVVAGVLLGANLSGAGDVVGRVGGLGLLSLGLACWPDREGVTARAMWSLLLYNLLAAVYLGYLSVGGVFISKMLWVAFGFHALLTPLFAQAAYKGASAAKAVRANPL